MRMQVQSLASLRRLGIQRCSELWYRPAAVTLIQPLAWELPYALGAALNSKKKKKKKKKIHPFMMKASLEYRCRRYNPKKKKNNNKVYLL